MLALAILACGFAGGERVGDVVVIEVSWVVGC